MRKVLFIGLLGLSMGELFADASMIRSVRLSMFQTVIRLFGRIILRDPS